MAVLLWLAGVYLRIPVLVAPPLAPFIGDELALTQALTGALTTLPILMLAIGSMPGSLAIARIGPAIPWPLPWSSWSLAPPDEAWYPIP